MKTSPAVVILCGALSPEREVSLRSGEACAAAMREKFPCLVLERLDDNAMPVWLDPDAHVIFPVIHGDYGEDGRIQDELEQRGFAFAGCGSASSRVCINKVETKKRLRATGLPVTRELAFNAAGKPDAQELASALDTEDIVLKPADKGSSVGLRFVDGPDAATVALAEIASGEWMAEPRLVGREMSVGILDGKAMGIVEIMPLGGRYDYASKYTPGAVEYRHPAALDVAVAEQITQAAVEAFAACGCRDFARLDLILGGNGRFHFLEINTMPGMASTSLFPKSAECAGLDFHGLCARMMQPALARFARRKEVRPQ